MDNSKLCVLVVDDYQPWRSYILSSLQKFPGLQVVGEASDGDEAVQKSRQLRPDLIVLDISLPSINGIEAARQIRQQLPDVMILFCSDHRSPEIAEEALQAGTGYLVKSDAGGDLLSAVAAVSVGKSFVSHALADCAFASVSDSSLVRDQKHTVQFYRDDAILLDELTALFRTSLGGGRCVAAVMTSSHRIALERQLLAQGIEVSEEIQEGRVCVLDADQALSQFMEPSGPSRERFLSVFANILRTPDGATAAKGSRAVVFGEMVAVLWAQKKYKAAIRLEELWNELALIGSFDLCCAYPVNIFRGGLSLTSYAEICAQHSHVVSAFSNFSRPAVF